MSILAYYDAISALANPALRRFMSWRTSQIHRLLTRGNPHRIPLDCRGGRILLASDHERMVVDVIALRRLGEFHTPPNDEGRAADTISECLLEDDHDRDSFRVVAVQHRHRNRAARAVEYRSRTGQWTHHHWVNNIRKPYNNHAMHAGRYVFWRRDHAMVLLPDTATMDFSTLYLPAFFKPTEFAIGDTADSTCCLVGLRGNKAGGYRLQLWLLEENDGGLRKSLLVDPSQTERFQEPPDIELPLDQVEGLDCEIPLRRVHRVSSGIAILYGQTARQQFAIDVKNRRLCGIFECADVLGFLLHMPWPPAMLLDHSRILVSQM